MGHLRSFSMSLANLEGHADNAWGMNFSSCGGVLSREGAMGLLLRMVRWMAMEVGSPIGTRCPFWMNSRDCAKKKALACLRLHPPFS